MQNTPEHKLDDNLIDEIATTFHEILKKYDSLTSIKDLPIKDHLKEVKGNAVNLARMILKNADASVDNDFDSAVGKLKTAYSMFMSVLKNLNLPPTAAMAILTALEYSLKS